MPTGNHGGSDVDPVGNKDDPQTEKLERYRLTVMYCDLVALTELSQRMSPEDIFEVLQAFRDVCSKHVSDHGGHISQFVGDGMLALFGYPTAHENDADRATHAALAIVKAMPTQKIPGHIDLQLSVRIGVATGEVAIGEVAGEGSHKEQVIFGDAPNLAARLQSIALPNTVVVSDNTRKQLRGYRFEWRLQGERRLKGFGKPIRVWEVIGRNAPFAQRPRRAEHPMSEGNPPTWASCWGQDQYGVWAGFTIGEVTQRMRWIPPGRFTMGSKDVPEQGSGLFDGEGPEHEVHIGEGFWLFDTPCTQALWQTVMGENPSYFKSDDRPVEQVSFDDVQAFLGIINTVSPGLNLRLPSEAEWEYACRARTTTETYEGDLNILGEANAQVLDPIAWYRGNCGVGFELDNGFDLDRLSNVLERQYPDSPGGTQRVGQKKANRWGLYDILGNVWEWCGDCWHANYKGAPADGATWLEGDDAKRVLRGGAWRNQARSVRSACRNKSEPDQRVNAFGFRCSQVQE